MGQKLLIKTRVERIIDEAPLIKRFVLTPILRPAFPAAAAGDNVIVLLPNGLRRSYSLCSDPADNSRWEIAVFREDAGLGGSKLMHEGIHEGGTLFVSYPQSGFRLAERAKHHVFIAGGIGLTPFLSMIPELARRRQPFDLHVCAKSPERLGFADCVSALPPNGRLHRWLGPGSGGRLNIADTLAHVGDDTHVYCCGPARMIEAFLTASGHWPEGHVHVERFIGLTLEDARQGDPFEVKLAKDGRRLTVPSNRSLLQVLREAEIAVDASCEGGACGSCRVGYLDGEPIHRDFCLRPEERRHTIAACVTRAKALLTLDL
jgi:ferredoxin-NADP reductase